MTAQPGGTGRERPIIFGAPMIRALLDGRKTQTRRALRMPETVDSIFSDDGKWWTGDSLTGEKHADIPVRYAVGQRLWAREAWANVNSGCGPGLAYKADGGFYQPEYDGKDFGAGPSYNYDKYPGNYSMWYSDLLAGADGHSWRSPIYMPRWASRITLTVRDVRVERLQEITEADAVAEGVELPSEEREDHDWSICPKCGGTRLHGALGDHLGHVEVDCRECDTARKRFRHLWESINGSGSWKADPWIAAISFSTALRNIDAPAPAEGRKP